MRRDNYNYNHNHFHLEHLDKLDVNDRADDGDDRPGNYYPPRSNIHYYCPDHDYSTSLYVAAREHNVQFHADKLNAAT